MDDVVSTHLGSTPKAFVVTVVNITVFFFHEGVWHHLASLFPGGMLMNTTHTSPGNPV